MAYGPASRSVEFHVRCSFQMDPGFDTSGVDAEAVARNVAQATDEQLREGMAGPTRAQILDEIFRRMEEHFDAETSGEVDAVVHWRIGGRPDGGEDQYEVVIRERRCAASQGFSVDPRVALTIDAVDFVRLVTGSAAGPQLFMAGKLRVEGDMAFAAGIAGLFRIPGG